MSRVYDHIGIPTKEPKENEIYVEKYKISVTPYDNSEFRIQWVRYHEGCSLPKIIQELPHVAFRVDNIQEAIKGKKVLLEPYYPLEGWCVAFIEECGAPVELIETQLSDEEVVAKERAIDTEREQ